ncbi:MAG: maleylpyruvate isomerase family mycothiol-dependent enzyme [Actinomycetota bacterium]
MGCPQHDIEAVRIATRRVLRSIDELTDAQAADASSLPDWTRAEVVAHLARNADGFRRLAEAAAAGERATMYPDGAEGRAAGIAAGRGERATALAADLRRATDALMDSWHALPAAAWNIGGRTPTATRTIATTVWLRLREIELHHVDLDLGYTCTDWPVTFVTRALAEAMTTLPDRATAGRPAVSAHYRIEATDHGRGWSVTLEGHDATVDAHVDPNAEYAAEVTGWGCDVLAWLNGRTPAGGTLTVSGDEMRALRLPQWFPYL